ncbi:MAG: Ig-like domain-containing protein [Eubacteriales bacterium]|nr:Ig-like domain-containing protein [Eubacteriales bacterium]
MKTKTMRFLRTLLLSLAVVFVVSGFGFAQSGMTAEAAGMSLSKKSVTLFVGKKATLTVKNPKKSVGWSSSNDDVVQINSISGTKDQKVVIEAVGKGTAKITAKIGSTKLTAKITVKAPTLSKTSASVNQGKTLKLTVKNPTTTVKWATSKKSVVKIKSSTGSKKQTVTLQGVKAGTATITAKVGTVTLKAKVTVKHVHSWKAATCTAPKTCKTCGATTGKALGHTVLYDADCTHDAKCTRCYQVVTRAYGHSFTAATCTEPQKCTRCGVTQGTALGHSAPQATCTTASVCTRCHTQISPALGHSYEAGICTRCGAVDLHHFFDMRIALYGVADYVRVDVTNNNVSGADTLYIGNRNSSTGNRAVVRTNGATYNALLVYDAVNYQTISEDSVAPGSSNYRCFFSMLTERELDVDASIDFQIVFKGKVYNIRVTSNGFEVL